MPHFPSIADQWKSGPVTACASRTERARRAETFKFRFEAWGTMLDELGLWKRVYTQTGRSITRFDPFRMDDADLIFAQGILNGNSGIDYEGLLVRPGELNFFNLLRPTVPGGRSRIAMRPSPLSVMHVLGAMLFGELLKGRSQFVQDRAAEQAIIALDPTKGNGERIRAYQFLADRRYGERKTAALVSRMMRELRLPANHPAHLVPGRDQCDVFVALFGTGLDREVWTMRKIMARYPDAYAYPQGFRSPDAIMRGDERGEDTEADVTIASLVSPECVSYFGGIPDIPELPVSPPVPYSRILLPEQGSTSTPQNAAYARPTMERMARELGRKVFLCLVGSPAHLARARVLYEQALSEYAEIFVFECDEPGHEYHLGYKVNANPFFNGIAEYLKRGHMAAAP